MNVEPDCWETYKPIKLQQGRKDTKGKKRKQPQNQLYKQELSLKQIKTAHTHCTIAPMDPHTCVFISCTPILVNIVQQYIMVKIN